MSAVRRTVPIAGVVGAAVLTLLIFGPSHDAAARPTQATVDPGLGVTTTEPASGRGNLQVEPSSSLVDGQAVNVTVTGFEPGERIGLVQCTIDPSLGYECNGYQEFQADANGEVHTTRAVERTIHDHQTGADFDCGAVQCFIGSGIPSGAFPDLRFDISFSAEPAPPAPPLGLAPNFTG